MIVMLMTMMDTNMIRVEIKSIIMGRYDDTSMKKQVSSKWNAERDAILSSKRH